MSTGRVKALQDQIKKFMDDGVHIPAFKLMTERDLLLTNGHQIPMPHRHLNQRQKRKRNRQTNRHE